VPCFARAVARRILPQIVQPLIEWVLSGRHWPPDPEESSEPAPTPTAKPVQPPKAAPSDKGRARDGHRFERAGSRCAEGTGGGGKAGGLCAGRFQASASAVQSASSSSSRAKNPRVRLRLRPAGDKKPPVETPFRPRRRKSPWLSRSCGGRQGKNQRQNSPPFQKGPRCTGSAGE